MIESGKLTSAYSIEAVANTPSLQDLLPGGLSTLGFLTESQTLDQVLRRDAKAMEILGYTAQEVADFLDPICNMPAFSEQIYIAPNGKHYAIRVIEYNGWQKCPWQDVRVPPHSSEDIYIQSEDKNMVRIPGMLPHLIRSHHFFEGGVYRLSPEDIIEMFGIEKKPNSISKAKQIQF